MEAPGQKYLTSTQAYNYGSFQIELFAYSILQANVKNFSFLLLGTTWSMLVYEGSLLRGSSGQSVHYRNESQHNFNQLQFIPCQTYWKF